jgi:parallel beta-helix repeat protein
VNSGQQAVSPPTPQTPIVIPQPSPVAPQVPRGTTRVLPGTDTLARAVADAAEGATLVLAPGGFLLSRPLKVAKFLTIKAEKPGRSLLVGDSGQKVLHLTGNATWVLLRGLHCKFRGDAGHVLLVDDGRVEIDQCQFTGAVSTDDQPGAGICITGTAEATITDCNVQGNDIGILFEEYSEGFALRNICRKNNGHGICVTGLAWPTLEENQCVENALCGIVYHDDSSGLARGNICRKNKLGIAVAVQAQPTLENNQCLENQADNLRVDRSIPSSVKVGCGVGGFLVGVVGAILVGVVGAILVGVVGAILGAVFGAILGAVVEAILGYSDENARAKG